MSTPSASRRDPRLVSLEEESGYRIHERIGAGGMGIVYRAHDADGNEVAIKLLRPDIADDPRARERLAREVASQRLVRNDGIVRILDAELDSPDAFVVTEFVPGPTLEDAVRRHGGLHPELVRELGLALASTLRDIHRAGVVHRDLKPSNVLLRGARTEDLATFDPAGYGLDPVIIDFGIAIAAEASRLTSTGLVMGTAAYLDPEVMRTGLTAESADWWALAAMLAFTATGREPFGTGRADLVLLRAERGDLDLTSVPLELADWLRSALQAEVAARPEPEELRARLENLDLTRYEDPGETEALPRHGFAGSSAAGREEDPFPGSDRTEALPRAGSRTEALPRAGSEPTAAHDAAAGGRTEAFPIAGESRTQALPLVGGTPTAALPLPGSARAEHEPRGGRDADAERTQALPRVEDDAQRTEALPRFGDRDPRGGNEGRRSAPPAEPSTEVLPAVGAATQVMPVIRDEAALAPQAARTPQSYREHQGFQEHQGYREPQRHSAAHAPQPAPQSYAPQPDPRGYAPQSEPQGWAPQPDPRVLDPYAGQLPPGQTQPAYAPSGLENPYGAFQQPLPPRRRLLVWLGHLILIALAAVAPYIALILFLALGGLARTWETSHRAMLVRRSRGKSDGGSQVAVGVAAPFRFVLGVLVTALQALFPLILGLLVGLGADALAVATGRVLPDAVAFGTAFAIMLLLTWVGIGSRTTRLGAHRAAAAATPDGVWGTVVGALLLLLLGAVVFVIWTRGGEVDYLPFLSWPRLTDIAFWR